MAESPRLTLEQVAALLGMAPDALAASAMLPTDGVRVWPSGLATLHRHGRVVALVAERRLHTVAAPPCPIP